MLYFLLFVLPLLFFIGISFGTAFLIQKIDKIIEALDEVVGSELLVEPERVNMTM